jgi:hypothetical protein
LSHQSKIITTTAKKLRRMTKIKNMLNMRKVHRWLGVPAAIFLLLASFTGVWLEYVKFFGAEETERERIRDLVSPVTAQSVGAEFGVSFDKVQAAAAARAGAQPLDKIVWQLKGEAPSVAFFFGPQGQQTARRIVVGARTGEIISVEEYAEDSFILRLHSGEAFGDGGMVLGMIWGTLLFALTVTGIIVYFRMKPRTPRTGIRKVFWAFAGALLFSSKETAKADSPFFTDDPLFSPGWEFKLGMVAEHNVSGDVLTGPIIDINYAIIPTVRLDLTMAGVGLYPDTGPNVYGFGTTDFKVKWRFLEEDLQSWCPALSVSPKVTIPTASTDRGLSDGFWRAQLPIEIGKTFGGWYHYAEAGYLWAFDSSATDAAFGGIATLYTFNKHFAAGTELYTVVPLDSSNDYTLLATLGAVYTFNANWSLKASISQSLRDDTQPGPRPVGQFYVVWNF